MEVLEEFEMMKIERDGLELGFFEKRRIKKYLKKLREGIEGASKEFKQKENLSQKEINQLKKKMIEAIIGKKETKKEKDLKET